MTITQEQQYTEQDHPMRRSSDRQEAGSGGTERVFQTTWENMNQPGAYVEVGSGDLYRVPREALVTGASPIITKESNGRSRLLCVSNNPYVPTLKARIVASHNNVQPNF